VIQVHGAIKLKRNFLEKQIKNQSKTHFYCAYSMGIKKDCKSKIKIKHINIQFKSFHCSLYF